MRIAQRFAAFRSFRGNKPENAQRLTAFSGSIRGRFKQVLPCTTAIAPIFPAKATIARRFRSPPDAHFAREAPCVTLRISCGFSPVFFRLPWRASA